LLQDIENAAPLFGAVDSVSPLSGFLSVLSTAPFFFAGFQLIPQLLEEKKETSKTSSASLMLMAIATAGLFYGGVVVAVAVVHPWTQSAQAALPTHFALVNGVGGAWIGALVLGTGVFGVLTTWNSGFVWAVRVVYALARAHLLPRALGRIGANRSSPAVATIVVGLLAALGGLCGRGLLTPLVNAGAIATCGAMLITCWCAWRLHGAPDPTGRARPVPGGRVTILAAMAGAGSITTYAIYEPFATQGRFPMEWMVLLGFFGLCAVWWVLGARARTAVTEEVRAAALLGEDFGRGAT
jgi:basic amino acid/polyamine antiporter, APA family